MKLSTWSVVFVFSFTYFLTFSGNALARWHVKAVWQAGNTWIRDGEGIGDSKDAALEAARQQCKDTEPLA